MRETTRDSLAWPGPRGGSGCTNDDCDASDTHRSVLSKREIEQVYRTPAAREALPFEWPLPSDIKYACTTCGWFYTERANAGMFSRPAPEPADLPFRIQDLSVGIDAEAPPGVNVRRLIANAPEGATGEEIVKVAERQIPGASREMVEELLEREATTDLIRFPAERFM